MNFLIISISLLYTVRGHAPEHVAEPRFIRWPTFSASTGQVIDLETAKSYIWRMSLDGNSFQAIIHGFLHRGVAVSPEFVSIIKQLRAIRYIDANYLDSVIDKIPQQFPDYYTRPFGEVVKEVFSPRFPPRHLRLFLSFCVDPISLINICPVEENVPMTSGDPLKVYVMPDSVYRIMLNRVGRARLMDELFPTNPLY